MTRGSSDDFIAGVGPISIVFPTDRIVVVVNYNRLTNDIFHLISIFLVVPTPLDELFQASWLDNFASIRPGEDPEQSVVFRKLVSNMCDGG